MKIVIAGGSGFVGKPLIEELKKKAYEITLLTRNPDKANIDGINIVRWDGKHAGGWEKSIDGSKAVINLSGEYIANRWTSEYKIKIINSRIDTTNAIVNAIKKASSKPKVLINASAVGYYGNVEEEDVTEDSPKGNGFLADACFKWEKSADLVKEHNVRLVKLRLGVVLEREGGALSKIIPPFLIFAGGPLGSGMQWFPWIHRDDVVGAIIYALENENVVDAINVTAPDLVNMKDFCAALGKSLKRPSWAPIPDFILKTLLGEMSDMLLTGQKAIPAKLIKYGYEFKYPQIDKALNAILN